MSSAWEQKPGLWTLEETGGRTLGAGQPLGTLTFADDPVEDGLQLLDADLQVLGGKGGWHVPWGEAAPPRCPEAPSTTPQPTSPASCLKRVLKFSSISSSESTCWLEEGEQVRDHPPPQPGPRMGSN